MKTIDLVKTANGNLTRSKLRTFLTVFSIVIGSFTLALSLGLGEGIRGYINSQIGSYRDANLYKVSRVGADSFGANFNSPAPKEYKSDAKQSINDISQLLLRPDEVAKIPAVKGVKNLRKPYSVTVEYLVGADGKKYTAPAQIDVPEISKTLLAGQLLNDTDNGKILLSNKYLSVIGATNSSQAIGKKVQVAFKQLDGSISEINFEIKGVIVPSIFDQPISYSEGQAKELATLQRGPLAESFASVLISKQDNVTDAELKAGLKAINLEGTSVKDSLNTLNSIITGAQIGLAAFSAIAILASVVGVVNTLFMAVLERTKEIGLFRALGAKRKTIFVLFSIEAILIGFWGSLFGLIVANLAKLGINSIASRTFLKGVDGYKLLGLPMKLQVLIILIIMFVTLLAGILPALKASRLNPIDALKYE